MNKGKIFSLILITLAILLMGIGIVMTVMPSQTNSQTEEKEVQKESKKEIVNGDLTNVEESFNKQRTINNYRLKNFILSKQADYYTFKVTVDNISTETIPESTLRITFLASNNDELGSLEITVPSLEPSSSTEVESLTSSAAIFETFDVKIEDITTKTK